VNSPTHFPVVHSRDAAVLHRRSGGGILGGEDSPLASAHAWAEPGGNSVMVKKGLFFLMLFPLAAWAQTAGSLGDQLHIMESSDWVIFGRTTNMRGNPLGDVTVRVDVGTGAGSVRALKTNLQGEFRTQFTFDANLTKRLTVRLVATKSGYTEAHETAELGVTDKTSGIELVLRELTQNQDQLSLQTLVSTLAPRLRQDAAKGSGAEAGRQEKEFVRGCEELIDRHAAVRAVPLLSKGVGGAPSCVECRLLLTLALLESGSWAGANPQLDEVTKLNDAATSKRPEPALIAGVLEEWRGETRTSAGFFKKALEIDPDNVLALQEMGRVLISQKNWEAADRYLERAIRAGASDEARLLRVRALLEEGDNVEAGREMDQYTAGHDMKTLPYEARMLYIQVKERLSLERYANVKSALTESPQDLMKAMPELKGTRMASNQDELKVVLQKAGEGVESFFKNFPNTVSLEQVHQERLGKDGKVARALDQDFQYLLLARTNKWGLGIEEHRATAQGESTTLGGYNQGLMLTAGFASVSLLFHPAYQDGTGFRYLGRQSLDGKDLHVIAFAQNPQTARTEERFSTDEGSALILIQGLAWIDPTTFQIVRLRTDLLAPQSKVRLQRQTTEIHFKEVSFKEVATAFWLPQEVSVTVDWKGRIYRNWHRYSDFKLFNVETKEERKALSLPAPPDQPK
jgi:tetratricopeptide (TPR) repeat protein